MLAPVLAPVLVAGCATTPAAPTPEAEAAAAASRDPLAAFAAEATPGAESRIVLADGQPALVRMTRSYFAASGRECRELLVGAGMGPRVQLVCAGADGAWVLSRPLLPGGGIVLR